MQVNPDFADLLHRLNESKARYLLVGGYAVIYYTEPRYTKDFDLWVDATPENAQKVFNALAKFGAPVSRLSPQTFTDEKCIYQIGMEPNRIDILMKVDGLKFASAWKNKKTVKYGKQRIYVLGMKDLIKNKLKTGRAQDKVDVENLGKLKKI